MKLRLLLSWMTLLLASTLAAAEEPKQPASAAAKAGQPPSLAEQFAAIDKQVDQRREEINEELKSVAGGANGPQEELERHINVARQKYTEFMQPLAEKVDGMVKAHAAHPDAFDGIVLLNGKLRSKPGLDEQIMQIVVKHHLAHPKLGSFVYDFRFYGNDPNIEALLKAAAEKNPAPEVRAQATYALGEYYRRSAQARVRVISDQEIAKFLADARRQFETVIRDYAEATTPHGPQKLAERAARELKRLANVPNLRIGKTAPEIVGEDIDGQSIKLSDSRGKVTVVVFWGSWCGPCMAMVPHERELFARTKGKPFVMFGVNGGDSRETAKKTTEDQKMVWRSAWDGGTPEGPIQTLYNVDHWPHIFVLDQHGVIRHIDIRGEELDKAVDALLAEMESATKKAAG